MIHFSAAHLPQRSLLRPRATNDSRRIRRLCHGERSIGDHVSRSVHKVSISDIIIAAAAATDSHRFFSPPPETGDGFECKSVMYYYNEQECILNAETRVSKPDLFIPEGDDFQVDYFDIACQLKAETCPNGRSPSAIRTINASLALGDNSSHVIDTTADSVAVCRERLALLSLIRLRHLSIMSYVQMLQTRPREVPLVQLR